MLAIALGVRRDLGLGLRLAQLAAMSTNDPLAMVALKPAENIHTAIGDNVAIDLQESPADLTAARRALNDLPLNAIDALEVIQNHRIDVRAAAQMQRQLGILPNFHVRISSSLPIAGYNILLLIYSIDKYF